MESLKEVKKGALYRGGMYIGFAKNRLEEGDKEGALKMMEQSEKYYDLTEKLSEGYHKEALRILQDTLNKAGENSKRYPSDIINPSIN